MDGEGLLFGSVIQGGGLLGGKDSFSQGPGGGLSRGRCEQRRPVESSLSPQGQEPLGAGRSLAHLRIQREGFFFFFPYPKAGVNLRAHMRALI